ncbi:MAG: DUF2461 domain-containing protein [Bacteroidales bacterium]|nr:DUF2461 domain-containing protein [Bacteroidales bacterium]
MKKMVLDFLLQLQENNNREWFQKNKAMYEEAMEEVESFVGSILPEMAGFEPALQFLTPKDCMFRIFRDMRFSKDKSPYKINIGAFMSYAGRKRCGPGYYMHLQPGESFLSAGIYMPDPESLRKIRKEIYYQIKEFKTILENKKLKKYCGGLDEIEKTKLAPKDFPKDFPEIDLLKNKHFTVSTLLTEKMILDEKFKATVVDIFHVMQPLNLFLKRALED